MHCCSRMLLCAVLGVLAEINYVFCTGTQRWIFHHSAVCHLSYLSQLIGITGVLFQSRSTISYALSCVRILWERKRANARGTWGGPNENDRKNCHYHSHCLKQRGSVSGLQRTSCQPGVGSWCHQWYFYVDLKMAANQGCSAGWRSLCRLVKFFHAKHVHAFIFFCSLACVGTRRGL